MDRLLGTVRKRFKLFRYSVFVTRDQELGAKELFLYSKSDFYIPYRYLVKAAII